MKKWFTLALVIVAAAAMVYMEDCGGPTTTPPVQNLEYTIIDGEDGGPGGAITLDWDVPDDVVPDGYYVDVDGARSDLLETTTYDVMTPGAIIEVFADYGADGMSNAVELDLGAVSTASLNVWDINDPSSDHPSGFGFSTSGTATGYALSGGANDADIDFWLDDDAGVPVLTSPDKRSPEINSEENSSDDIEGTSYEALGLASETGVQLYTTNQPLADGGVYALWIDPDAAGYTSDDHFGKAKVNSITGDQVNFTLAFQTVTGLRWIVVE